MKTIQEIEKEIEETQAKLDRAESHWKRRMFARRLSNLEYGLSDAIADSENPQPPIVLDDPGLHCGCEDAPCCGCK